MIKVPGEIRYKAWSIYYRTVKTRDLDVLRSAIKVIVVAGLKTGQFFASLLQFVFQSFNSLWIEQSPEMLSCELLFQRFDFSFQVFYVVRHQTLRYDAYELSYGPFRK